jgi:hypothetical protein
VKKLYVAVVMVKDKLVSSRPNGDYACFINKNRSNAIKRALQAKNEWGSSKYIVVSGTLTQRVFE